MSTNANPDSIACIYEIEHGDKELLLAHVDAVINIFKKAKEQLEEEMKGDK